MMKTLKKFSPIFLLLLVTPNQLFAFPTFEEWYKGILIEASTEQSLREQLKKSPELFREDVLDTFSSPQYGQFKIMDNTVFFGFNAGQVITRIQGAYILEKAIDELKLTHVKVPRLVYWLDMENKKGFLFAERIHPRLNKITADEIRDIRALINKTHFSDYVLNNLIAGEDAVYFVDTGDWFRENHFNPSRFYIQSALKNEPGFDDDAIRVLELDRDLEDLALTTNTKSTCSPRSTDEKSVELKAYPEELLGF